jgi:tetratricopeptide (TPR) repeat protein
MEAFRRALREYPESRYGNDKPVASVAAYEIVYCLSMKGELEEAKKAYEEAVKKYPNATTPNGRFLKDIFAPPADEGEVLYRRAESLRSKKPEESLKIHQDLLAKYPKHRLAGAALTNSGRILYRFGRFDEAVAAMKRVLAEYPDSRFWSGGVCAMTAAYELGYWYYEKKDMQNAKKAFDFAVARYPDGAYYSKQYAGIIKEVNEAVGKPREDTKPVGEPKAP